MKKDLLKEVNRAFWARTRGKQGPMYEPLKVRPAAGLPYAAWALMAFVAVWMAYLAIFATVSP